MALAQNPTDAQLHSNLMYLPKDENLYFRTETRALAAVLNKQC